MLDSSTIASFFDGQIHLDDIKVEDWDKTGDGQLTIYDSPFVFGSKGAKLWWKKVFEPHCYGQEIPAETKAKYGDKVIGMLDGGPLVPGEAGQGQKDFVFLCMKLKVCEGLDVTSARKIASKYLQNRYGG